MATKGKPPLSCSSNSNSASPSSPSSSLQHKSQFMAALSQMQIYGNQQHHQVGSTPNWLGNKFDYDSEPEGGASCRFNDGGAASSNLELMDIEEDGRAESAATAVGVIEKEHMFDKVVTPSDVGKLNRLVIPKQHAEKYFPLDSSTYEKGLLLNFEDRNGKPWRFRYSYWNSSQSYVMTKGWSRFVKDKKLDAGDVVSFQRGVGDLGKDRLYIDWRRRLDARHPAISCQYYQQPFSSIPWTAWSPLLMRPPTTAPLLARDHIHSSNLSPDINAYHSGGSAYGFGSCAYGGSNNSNAVKVNPCSSYAPPTFHDMRPAAPSPAPRQQVGMARVIQWQQGGNGHGEPVVYESVPVVQGKAAAKSLRLFGVNMVCPITESNDQCDDILLSSNTIPPHTKQRQQQHPPHGN